mgnify:CR=1 FL=1|jgi:hypothetical protein
MLYGFAGERVDTRKPARGGLSGGVFSHVGTCENLHLVGRGNLNRFRMPLKNIDYAWFNFSMEYFLESMSLVVGGGDQSNLELN